MNKRVLIVDDHKMLRTGVALLLREAGGYEIVGELGALSGLVEAVRTSKPDLLLLDVSLPDGNALSMIGEVRRTYPLTKVLILTGSGEPHYIRQAIDAGVYGYILKEQSFDELLVALDTINSGKAYLCPAASAVLARSIPETATAAAEAELSEREKVLIRMICEGYRSKEIAEALSLNVKTAESCRCRLMDRLGINSTAELVRYAIRRGLITP